MERVLKIGGVGGDGESVENRGVLVVMERVLKSGGVGGDGESVEKQGCWR